MPRSRTAIPTDLELLDCISRGWRFREIAEEYSVSIWLISAQVNNLRQRMAAKTSMQMVYTYATRPMLDERGYWTKDPAKVVQRVSKGGCSMIEIPKYIWDGHDKGHWIPGSPAWSCPVTLEGKTCKPIIRCNCGKWCGIGLHHVHEDGTVTASFYHAHSSTGLPHSSEEGCGWHVWLKLKDYDKGEFLPDAAK